ncbi:uncharacterized protein LOC116302743 [Actinia tenebrosa]|uniref:Uncharacterized protein LOC116302743 n=1 Tax=Actinia tenebrosa TaxID=6105 RepID=A0A6P8ILV2_ACTTE|nr:uncharacterized protein LOC116302743 [Actinia tenebrosa]
MADEPSTKKQKTEQGMGLPKEEKGANERSITLHLSKYPESIRSFTDEELEKVFEIGVLVRESLQMTVSSNQKHLEQVLASELDVQMKQVQATVASIKEQVNQKVLDIERNVSKSVSDNILDMTKVVNKFKQDVNGELTNLKTDLVTNVSGVADKVPPLDSLNTKINDSKTDIIEEVRKIDISVQALGKPKTKGSMGERLVLTIIKEAFPNFTVEHTATFGNSGDVLVTTPEEEKFPVEVKNLKSPVAKKEIAKFEKLVVDHFPEAKVGIMLSLESGIARRSLRGKFEISLDRNKYFIYVPNALEEGNLKVIWSVMLARELAQLNAELKENQTSKLSTLYERFKNNIENAKKSRRNLESLEATVKNLKESMEPILKIVEQSETDIYKILHLS